MSMFTRMKETLLENTFLAYKRGLFAGTSGNLSCLDATGTKIAITPSSYPYEKMTQDDIVIIEASSGAVVEGKRKPSSEWRMHTAIYREVSGARGVVHIHSPYATALAVAGKGIPLVLIETLVYIGGDVPLAEFGLPGTEELGAVVAKTLQSRNACLMANHGAVAIGESLEQAMLRATYIEDAAKIYFLALQAGGAVALSDKDLEAMRKNLGN